MLIRCLKSPLYTFCSFSGRFKVSNFSFTSFIYETICNKRTKKDLIGAKKHSELLSFPCGIQTSFSVQAKFPGYANPLSGDSEQFSGDLSKWSLDPNQRSGAVAKWSLDPDQWSGALAKWSLDPDQWSGAVAKWSLDPNQWSRAVAKWSLDPNRWSRAVAKLLMDAD